MNRAPGRLSSSGWPPGVRKAAGDRAPSLLRSVRLSRFSHPRGAFLLRLAPFVPPEQRVFAFHAAPVGRSRPAGRRFRARMPEGQRARQRQRDGPSRHADWHVHCGQARPLAAYRECLQGTMTLGTAWIDESRAGRVSPLQEPPAVRRAAGPGLPPPCGPTVFRPPAGGAFWRPIRCLTSRRFGADTPKSPPSVGARAVLVAGFAHGCRTAGSGAGSQGGSRADITHLDATGKRQWLHDRGRSGAWSLRC